MIDDYFRTARERHEIMIRRRAGLPFPWTTDPIFQKYRFCNVFREEDTTTQWFRKYVRDPLRNQPEVLLATVVFRLFNRITTGEAIFSQTELESTLDLDKNMKELFITGQTQWKTGLHTAWDRYLRSPDMEHLRGAILKYCGDGPYVTGSYIIKTPSGMNKLDGVLQIIDWFVDGDWKIFAEDLLEFRTFSSVHLKQEGHHWPNSYGDQPFSLEQAWTWFRQYRFIGDFTAYELVSDLRHTALLENAPDINTWCNLGPGAKRGLNVTFGREPNENVSKAQQLDEAQQLLQCSRLTEYWPKEWPAWEMREVEHWACEHFKYWRVAHGGPGTRQRFRHP